MQRSQLGLGAGKMKMLLKGGRVSKIDMKIDRKLKCCKSQRGRRAHRIIAVQRRQGIKQSECFIAVLVHFLEINWFLAS